jgi:hypothetical protein
MTRLICGLSLFARRLEILALILALGTVLPATVRAEEESEQKTAALPLPKAGSRPAGRKVLTTPVGVVNAPGNLGGVRNGHHRRRVRWWVRKCRAARDGRT